VLYGVIQKNIKIKIKDMTEDLGPLEINKYKGTESFINGNDKLDFDILSFWQWGGSDIVNNTNRGILAEYLVAKALGIVGQDSYREQWASFDLEAKDGISIEVKSSAYLQSWGQDKLSKPSFGIRKTRDWDSKLNTYSDKSEHQADLYIFALLAHQVKKTVNPLDVSQWEFYVLPTKKLEELRPEKNTITLSSLKKLTQSVNFIDLKSSVEDLE